MLARRPLAATVVGQSERGPRVEVLGLYAALSRRAGPEPGEEVPGRTNLPPGQEVEVRITRMDPDEGRIFVSDRLVATGQLPLF